MILKLLGLQLKLIVIHEVIDLLINDEFNVIAYKTIIGNDRSCLNTRLSRKVRKLRNLIILLLILCLLDLLAKLNNLLLSSLDGLFTVASKLILEAQQLLVYFFIDVCL